MMNNRAPRSFSYTESVIRSCYQYRADSFISHRKPVRVTLIAICKKVLPSNTITVIIIGVEVGTTSTSRRLMVSLVSGFQWVINPRCAYSRRQEIFQLSLLRPNGMLHHEAHYCN